MDQPDYGNPAWWSVHPFMESYAASRINIGGDRGDGRADVFYVHPTTTSTQDWNQAAANPLLDDWTDRSAVIPHLQPFAGICNLYAPRYRQAGPRALREPGRDADTAWDIAFQDVRRAFAHYLGRAGCDRNFILLGHSQGALHISRLLTEVIEADGHDDRLVAAYIIGIGLSEGLFGSRFRRIAPCTAADQTGCVISWCSFLEGADTSALLERTRLRDSRVHQGPLGLPLCTNPLSYAVAQPCVPATENPGTLTGEAGVLPLGPVIPGLFGARVDGGVVRVDAPPAGLGLEPLPGGNMHMHDIALFHTALRLDARRRVRRMRAAKRTAA
jgi:hypothetical protein